MGLVETNGLFSVYSVHSTCNNTLQDLYELKLKVALNANNEINLIIHFTQN
jgi:hypothetical protein